jgi:hypothetical protein
MANVGVSVATSAWLLASANRDDARAIRRLVERAAAARMDVEARNAAELARDGRHDPAVERAVQAAWKKWYAEALETADRLAVRDE